MLLPLLVALLAATASAASAAMFTVNDPNDFPLSGTAGSACSSTDGGSCTLRAAVQAADKTGGTNTITLPTGDYKLTIPSATPGQPSNGDLDITTGDNLTISGAGAASTIIDANELDRAFAVQSGTSLSISGVTIRGGEQTATGPGSNSTAPGDGGAIYTDGTLSVQDSVLSGNSAVDGGGGVFADTTAVSTSIANSTLTGETADSSGGAVWIMSGGLTLTNDTISHDSANGAGGAVAVQSGPVVISGSTIADDVANNAGGAVYLSNAGPLSVSSSALDGDSTGNQEGGAIYDQSSGPITVTGSTLSGDSTGSQSGGAIFAGMDPLLSVAASTFDGDSAGNNPGGALAMNGTNLSVTGSTFSGDEGEQGGAINVDGSSPTALQSITSSTFTGNAAVDNEGGAIYDRVGNLQVSGSTFTANNSDFDGGGLYYASGDGLALTNDTFDSNEASSSGAGIYLQMPASTGTISLLNDTIARNSANAGGGIANPGDANSIKNTIVAENFGGVANTGGADCQGAAAHDNAGAADAGGNIDSDGSCFSAGVAHDQTGVNPALGPLAANGGPTETDALLAGSPAIGGAVSGTCPPSDQRGVPRPAACDAGAFQTVPADVGISVSGPASATVGTPVSFTLTVTDNGPGSATGVTVSDTLPPGTTFFSSSSSQGSCSGTSTVTCALGTLDSTNTGTVTTATVTIVLVANHAGSLTNTATVSAAEPDPNPANNSASATTAINAAMNVTPVVLTGAASQITATSAKLSGIINPAGESTAYTFQLGTIAGRGMTLSGGTLAAGSTPAGVVTAVNSLTPGTTYHFRVVAQNANGTSDGQDAAFNTPRATPKSLSLNVARKGRRFTFSGKLTLPAGVSASVGCKGTVTIKIKHGVQTLTSPQARLSGKCTYSVSRTFSFRTGTLALTPTFVGNPALNPKSRRTLDVRVG